MLLWVFLQIFTDFDEDFSWGESFCFEFRSVINRDEEKWLLNYVFSDDDFHSWNHRPFNLSAVLYIGYVTVVNVVSSLDFKGYIPDFLHYLYFIDVPLKNSFLNSVWICNIFIAIVPRKLILSAEMCVVRSLWCLHCDFFFCDVE